jgi:hypothetical protein
MKLFIALSPRSVPITFKPPGSIEAYAKLLFVAIANVQRCTLSLLILFPITVNSFDR